MPRNYSFVLPWQDFNHRLELFSILFILVCVDIALRLGSYLDIVYVCLDNAQNVCRPRTPVRHIRPNVSASHVCLYIYLYLLDCELNSVCAALYRKRCVLCACSYQSAYSIFKWWPECHQKPIIYRELCIEFFRCTSYTMQQSHIHTHAAHNRGAGAR